MTEYSKGQLDGKVVSLTDNKIGKLVAKGKVISGDTAGIFLDEVGYIEEGFGVKKSYCYLELQNYTIKVHDE
ncbi:hypothetical protein L2744_00335 [Shewanella profunda]|uniref:hypothetical protein n=1 Tax=Shewanella TaxID=22 RepID=UPI0020106BC9|nr:hypothetical protein [Shewanella profunda]MCL1088080.1 hypothetical protein [Shewanella profunda]